MRIRNVGCSISGGKLGIDGDDNVTWYEISTGSLTEATVDSKITVIEKYSADTERMTTIELRSDSE